LRFVISVLRCMHGVCVLGGGCCTKYRYCCKTIKLNTTSTNYINNLFKKSFLNTINYHSPNSSYKIFYKLSYITYLGLYIKNEINKQHNRLSLNKMEIKTIEVYIIISSTTVHFISSS